MWQAECRTPEKIQDVLDKGCSAVKEIKSLHEQHQELTVKVDNHVQKLQPLVERLSGLITQIAEVERFRAYVSWIQKIKSVRYSNYKKFANATIGDKIVETLYLNRVFSENKRIRTPPLSPPFKVGVFVVFYR